MSQVFEWDKCRQQVLITFLSAVVAIFVCVEDDMWPQFITNNIIAWLGIPDIRANSRQWQPRYNVNHYAFLIAVFTELATRYCGKNLFWHHWMKLQIFSSFNLYFHFISTLLKDKLTWPTDYNAALSLQQNHIQLWLTGSDS